MAIADDSVHALERGDLSRRALRVTARHHDRSRWVLAPHPAEKGAGRALGLSGHAAGIDHHHIRRRGSAGSDKTAMAQLSVNGFTIGPICAASEVLNVIFCHVVSLSMATARDKAALRPKVPIDFNQGAIK